VNKVPGNVHISTNTVNTGSSFFDRYYDSDSPTSWMPNLNSDKGDNNVKESDKKKQPPFTKEEQSRLEVLANLDISHEIVHFSFGTDTDLQAVTREFKGSGILNPLDRRKSLVKYKEYKKPFTNSYSWTSISPPTDKSSESTWKTEDEMRKVLKENKNEKTFEEATTPQPTIFEYYCNVVPTTYRKLSDFQRHVYQFTANSNKLTANTHQSSIYFRYGLSPVTVNYTDSRRPFFGFLVQTMGLVGGLFTVAGILESILYQGIQTVQKKFEMGKLT